MLGRHLLARLERDSVDHVELGRSSEPVSWDLSHWPHPGTLDGAFGDCDAVVHAGALIPRRGRETAWNEWYDANVRACAALAEWGSSAEVPIVFISSASVYSNPNAQSLNESDARGGGTLGGLYATSKLLGERVFEAFMQEGGRCAILRPSSLYGTGEAVGALTSRFVRAAQAGEQIELKAPFDDTFDFIHAADVADAVVRVMVAEAWETLNVASGREVTLVELAESAVAAVGRGSVLRAASAVEARAGRPQFQLDTTRARRLLGFQSSISLRSGLRALHAGEIIAA